MGEYDECYDDEFYAGTKCSTADAQEEKKDIPKPIFYRISYLPLSMNEDNMWDILETLPAPASSPHDQNNAKVDNLSVCHSADMQTKTAVVVFWNHTPRKFLPCRPKEPIKVKLGGYLKENNIGPYPELEDREVEIDVDFLGITPVFEHVKEPKFDIVVLGCLGGHPITSWCREMGDYTWIMSVMGQDIEPSRVMIYGYDSALQNSTNNSTIADYAQGLLSELKVWRAEQKKKSKLRPLIFIGHDIGGLIIKQALLDVSSPGTEDYKDFFLNTVGLYFFGVPNLGLDHEALLEVTRGRANEQLIRDLMPGSTMLKNLHHDFMATIPTKLPDCLIIAFYETRDTPSIQVSEEGQITNTGPAVYMVTKESATACCINSFNGIPTFADHYTMVKFFGRQLPPTQAVFHDRLLDCLDVAEKVVKARFENAELVTGNSTAQV